MAHDSWLQKSPRSLADGNRQVDVDSLGWFVCPINAHRSPARSVHNRTAHRVIPALLKNEGVSTSGLCVGTPIAVSSAGLLRQRRTARRVQATRWIPLFGSYSARIEHAEAALED